MPKARLELARPCEHYDLNVACIPFHHFGATITTFFVTEESVPLRNVFVKPLSAQIRQSYDGEVRNKWAGTGAATFSGFRRRVGWQG